MGEKFIKIRVHGVEAGIWRVSEEQWEVIKALKDLGAFNETVTIEEIKIRYMN